MCSKVKPLKRHKHTHTQTHTHTDRLTMLFVVQLHSWQPGIKNPYRGMVVWPVPENIDISVTLFKVPKPEHTVYTIHTQTGDNQRKCESCAMALSSHQISDQLETYERFWSHHRHQMRKYLLENGVHPSCRVQSTLLIPVVNCSVTAVKSHMMT